MSDTILVAIIGGISTIIVPVLTWFLTSKSKEKEKLNALDSMQKDHEHELERIKLSNEHDLEVKEKEFEFALAKLQAESESTKDLDQTSLINGIIEPFFKSQINDPDSIIGKTVNEEIKKATKQNSNNFIRNKNR